MLQFIGKIKDLPIPELQQYTYKSEASSRSFFRPGFNVVYMYVSQKSTHQGDFSVNELDGRSVDLQGYKILSLHHNRKSQVRFFHLLRQKVRISKIRAFYKMHPTTSHISTLCETVRCSKRFKTMR